MVMRRMVVMNEGTAEQVRFRVTAKRGEVIVDVPVSTREVPDEPFRFSRLRFTTDEAERLTAAMGEAVHVSRT